MSTKPLCNVSPAKARKLENVMRGMSSTGITCIGFGTNAPSVGLDELYPMEISRSVPAEKNVRIVDQSDDCALINRKVTGLSVRNRRRSSSQQLLLSPNSQDSISGRKRRGDQIHLQTHTTPSKRHRGSSVGANFGSMMAVDGPSRSPSSARVTPSKPPPSHRHQLERLQQTNTALDAENASLRQQLTTLSSQLSEKTSLASELDQSRARNHRACSSLQNLLNEMAASERQERESQLAEDNKLLGRVVSVPAANLTFGSTAHDVWEDGQLFGDLKRRRKALEAEKDAVEAQKKELRKQRALRKKNLDKENEQPTALSSDASRSRSSEATIKELDPLSLDAEVISIRLSAIKKQLQELELTATSYEYRKKVHIKRIRRMRDEKRSRFFSDKKGQGCVVLENRYVLTNLLGRGGFSEVHRAYDLREHRYVAAKVHQLKSQWSEERKRSYTKHATREYDIHRALDHSNVVRLFDVFGIDVNSFCTVLEYVDGMDLDMYLKVNKTLGEREARSLLIQILVGLKYLHGQHHPIIHYDLKPGNLLYKEGKVKLTDFGLAKIMERDMVDDSGCIELTSQGAGTYWYLPPECFRRQSFGSGMAGQQMVMISTKVDIWSAGIIYYQMLYGRRPFGDTQSQDTILSNKTILNAHQVVFPSQPKGVSKQAKELIMQCCAYDPKCRPPASEIVDRHPYFDALRK